jgi:hypothetical protein
MKMQAPSAKSAHLAFFLIMIMLRYVLVVKPGIILNFQKQHSVRVVSRDPSPALQIRVNAKIVPLASTHSLMANHYACLVKPDPSIHMLGVHSASNAKLVIIKIQLARVSALIALWAFSLTV